MNTAIRGDEAMHDEIGVEELGVEFGVSDILDMRDAEAVQAEEIVSAGVNASRGMRDPYANAFGFGAIEHSHATERAERGYNGGGFADDFGRDDF